MKCFVILLFCLIAQTSIFAATEPTSKNGNGKCPELTGKVIMPNDARYEKARLDSNYYTSKKRFPKAIVYAQNTQDVQNAVKWAKCQNIPIRIRSGGHHHESFSTGSDAIVIDVSEMKKIHINKEKNVATVQPGITGGELYAALYKEKLTQVGGTCADVGISGLILTGGMGPLVKKYGLSCDNLISLEMVTAQGDVVQVTKDNAYKDLFWASCGGGGGNFGVVTSLVLKVYPIDQVTWYNIGWDWEQPIEKVITTWQEVILNGDEKIFGHLDLWSKEFPSDEFKKMPVKALGVYFGTPEEAKKALAPLLAIGKPADQTINLVDWDKAIKEFEESTVTFITDKPEYKSTGAYAMKPLTLEAIRTLISTLENTTTRQLNVLFLALGGAASLKAPTDTAYFYRGAKFLITYSTQWLEEKENTKILKEVDTLRQKMLPYTIGDYIGNPDSTFQDYLTTYYGNNVHRLRCIKKKYDPDNLFRFEQSIPPATEACP